MENLIVKKELIKATGSIYRAIILDYLTENNSENWFEINFEKLIKDMMLDISISTLRREVKKLVKEGFLMEMSNKKAYQYQVDKSRLKYIQTGILKENFNDIQNKNYIILHNNDTILQEKSQDKSLENIENFIKDNIDYDILVGRNGDESERNMFENIYLIILETLTSNEEFIRINNRDVHIEIVRSVFKKVNASVLTDVVFKMQRLNNKIINFKSYLTTAIYNTYLEREFQIRNSIYLDFGTCE